MPPVRNNVKYPAIHEHFFKTFQAWNDHVQRKNHQGPWAGVMRDDRMKPTSFSAELC